MQKSIFLGNGINLLKKGTKSWSGILKELSKIVNDTKIIDLIDYKPFTLVYEAICSKYFQGGRRDDDVLKKHVADLLGQMQHNFYHHNFVELGAKHIITTNYDYCLEHSISDDVIHDDVKSESRYSVFRRTKSLSTQIWHIHGEIEKPRTIMLGHEQYGGYLQKLRSYLTEKNNGSPFVSGQNNFEINKVYSWADLFLRDEIHIVGFSLDFSEIDLWWLLSYKARAQKIKKLKCGPTYYYHWSSKAVNDRDKAKIQLLESLGVIVKIAYGLKDFSKEYDRFMIEFKN